MIPRQLLMRMGIYDVPVDGGKYLKVVVTDNQRIVADKLENLKSSLSNSVVAVDLKLLANDDSQWIIILSSRSFCLVARAPYPCMVLPLRRFMVDESICFVGMISDAVRGTAQVKDYVQKTVELGHLAARVLKKRGLMDCRCLKTLAGEAGVELKQEPTLGANGGELGWNQGIFSQSEVEYATHRALSVFLVAEKLLASIP